MVADVVPRLLVSLAISGGERAEHGEEVLGVVVTKDGHVILPEAHDATALAFPGRALDTGGRDSRKWLHSESSGALA